MKIKITKRNKLHEVNNEKCWNFYFLVCGRIISDDKKLYRRFKFVVWFDAFDVQEYAEKDYFTNRDVYEYLDTCIDGYLDYVKGFDDCKEFYNVCNNTIHEYNKSLQPSPAWY